MKVLSKFSKALEDGHAQLKELDLSSNFVRRAGVRCLARAVVHKPGLKLLDINGNFISVVAKTSIVSFLALRIYSLDAAITYENISSNLDLTDSPKLMRVTSTPRWAVANGAYVLPSMRADADISSGMDMRRRNEENVVRVSNLSEDTHEADLHELFSRFGPPTRVYAAIDHKFGLSRGFGYVNSVNMEDAGRAINKLSGFVYDSLILHVEWSPPRSLFGWDPNGNQAPQCQRLISG